MLLLPSRELPEGANWAYELKLDGYRAQAVRTEGRVHLRSRNDKDFNARYPAVVKALAGWDRYDSGTVVWMNPMNPAEM
jgi:bifunctional non-homologous end joining protein LigD